MLQIFLANFIPFAFLFYSGFVAHFHLELWNIEICSGIFPKKSLGFLRKTKLQTVISSATRHSRVLKDGFKCVHAFQIASVFGSAGFSGEGKTGLPKESHIGGRQTPSPLHQPYYFRVGQNFQNELPVRRSILAKFAAYQLHHLNWKLNWFRRKTCVILYGTSMTKAVVKDLVKKNSHCESKNQR